MSNTNTSLPPDPDQMNDARAEWAEMALHTFNATEPSKALDAALEDFQNSTGTDDCDAAMDLMADLFHLCDREGATPEIMYFFEALLRHGGGNVDHAECHYSEETNGRGRKWGRKLARLFHARNQFDDLAGVNNDPMTQESIADLVSAAKAELDLFVDGESSISKREAGAIRRFIKKWEGK